MHLLLGYAEDLCCAGVLERLEARGLPVRIVAPLAPPARLTWLDAAGISSREPVVDDRLAGGEERDRAGGVELLGQLEVEVAHRGGLWGRPFGDPGEWVAERGE